MANASTRMHCRMNAPRESVYRALLDPRAVERWKVPHGMTSQIHDFNATEGGAFRVTLTYANIDGRGKTDTHSDTYHGRFVRLVPNEMVVEAMEFDTADPAMQGEMRITYLLTDANPGTDLHALHENLPSGVSPAENEAGWRMALENLANLVEGELKSRVKATQ